MEKAHYRKYNDRSQNSSKYHKKDGTAVRAMLKQELGKEVKNIKRMNPCGTFMLDGRKFKWEEGADGYIMTSMADGGPVLAEWLGRNYDQWRLKCLQARKRAATMRKRLEIRISNAMVEKSKRKGK